MAKSSLLVSQQHCPHRISNVQDQGLVVQWLFGADMNVLAVSCGCSGQRSSTQG